MNTWASGKFLVFHWIYKPRSSTKLSEHGEDCDKYQDIVEKNVNLKPTWDFFVEILREIER